MINEKTAELRVRIEPELKAQAHDLLLMQGITLPQALRMFLLTVVEHRGLPFELKDSQNVKEKKWKP